MGVRILHAADMHLGREFKQLGERAPARQADLIATFHRICDVARDQQVAALLLAGDLFDVYNPPSHLVAAAQSCLEDLASAGVRVYVIPGNHDDISYPDSVWRRYRFAGVHVFTRPTFSTSSFEAGGLAIHVHGLAYDHTVCTDPLPTLDLSAGGIHIGMLHATVDVPDYQIIEQRYLPLTSVQLRETGLTYVALGHIHRPHVFGDAINPFACYPGSPEGLTIRETGDRHVALLDFETGRHTLTRIKVNTKTVAARRVPVDDMVLDQIGARLTQDADPDLLLSATLTGCPRDVPDIEYLAKRLGDSFFWLDLHDGTEMFNSSRIEEIAMENTIRGRFVRGMRERIQAAAGTGEAADLEMALKLAFIELEKRSVA